MNYYERHIGDYLKDTSHLSLLEHGVYTRLLDVYYTREGALPVDQMARLIGARSKEERAAMQAVLAEFFVATLDGFKQARCDREIERFQDKQRKAKASAEARWAHTGRNANASANAPPCAMRTHDERMPNAMPRAPVPSLQTPDTTTDSKNPTVGAAKRGTRIPKAWEPGESGMAFAAQQGLVNGRIATELDKFRDHWAAATGQTATKADWQAAWRNWVRRAVDMAPTKARGDSGDVFEGAH